MNQSDHYLPQTYMRGFVASDASSGKPLFVFVRSRARWERKSTVQICKATGYYDHSDPILDKEVKDRLWAAENTWPSVVRELGTPNLIGWSRARAQVLQFIAVQAVRNPLFRTRILAHRKSMADDHARKGSAPHDRALEEMLSALPEISRWLHRLDWALRWTDQRNPFITCDQCVFVEGKAASIAQAINLPETLVFFPITATLLVVGATTPFTLHSARMLVPDIERLYGLVFRSAEEYVIGPKEVTVPGGDIARVW